MPAAIDRNGLRHAEQKSEETVMKLLGCKIAHRSFLVGKGDENRIRCLTMIDCDDDRAVFRNIVDMIGFRMKQDPYDRIEKTPDQTVASFVFLYVFLYEFPLVYLFCFHDSTIIHGSIFLFKKDT